eukprot:4292091-Alexandrium_andersonii.AAC.1
MEAGMATRPADKNTFGDNRYSGGGAEKRGTSERSNGAAHGPGSYRRERGSQGRWRARAG